LHSSINFEIKFLVELVRSSCGNNIPTFIPMYKLKNIKAFRKNLSSFYRSKASFSIFGQRRVPQSQNKYYYKINTL
jgi:hypothetical protein